MVPGMSLGLKVWVTGVQPGVYTLPCSSNQGGAKRAASYVLGGPCCFNSVIRAESG